jgi:hypothetical protein
MNEVVVKILVEVLSILALATKQIEQGKPSESVFGEALHYMTQCKCRKTFQDSWRE